MRARISKIQTKKRIQRIKETKTWFFETIKKIDKPMGIYPNDAQSYYKNICSTMLK